MHSSARGCVASLSVGGALNTVFAISVVELVQHKGYASAVLSLEAHSSDRVRGALGHGWGRVRSGARRALVKLSSMLI